MKATCVVIRHATKSWETMQRKESHVLGGKQFGVQHGKHTIHRAGSGGYRQGKGQGERKIFTHNANVATDALNAACPKQYKTRQELRTDSAFYKQHTMQYL